MEIPTFLMWQQNMDLGFLGKLYRSKLEVKTAINEDGTNIVGMVQYVITQWIDKSVRIVIY